MFVHRLLFNGKSEQVPDEFRKISKMTHHILVIMEVGTKFGVDE